MSDSIARTTDKPVRRSLCCVCGTVRTVSDNYAPRGRQYYRMGWTPEEIERCKQMYPGDPRWAELRPWVRSLERLKCATCRAVTEHAIASDAGRDPSEEANANVTRDWQRARETADDIALLTGAHVEWREQASEDTTASLTQYLDDGEWFLTVYEGPTATAALNALHKLYMHLLADNATWYVTGPDPLDPSVVPHRGLAYGTKHKK